MNLDELTPYEHQIFSNIDKNCKLDQWYNIKPDRRDLKEFMAALEKFSAAWHDCLVIDKENYKFKRILPQQVIDNLKTLGINHGR